MRLTNQFFAGALTGASLAGLLVLSLALVRIEESMAFADQNRQLFFAAIDDVEALRDYCGVPCQEQPLSYLNLMERFGYGAGR